MQYDEQIIKNEFGKAILKYRKNQAQKITQKMLAIKIIRYANSKKIKQEIISKLECGKDVFLTDEEINCLQEICSIPEDIAKPFSEMMHEKYRSKVKENFVSIQEHDHLLTKNKNDEVVFYEGDYYCYFHSTDSDEHKIVEGKMSILPFKSSDICEAKFVIYENEKSIKEYTGQFFLNNLYDMSYCILIGEDKQETCFLISNHFNASTQKRNLFNIALVLTTSAGKVKIPTMHRMFISRKKLNNDTIEILLSQLKLNSDVIYISEEKLNEMKKYYKNKDATAIDEGSKQIYQYVLKTIQYIQSSNIKKTYYSIDEATLYNTNTIIPTLSNKYIQSMVISELRKNTEIEFYNKIDKRVTDICFNVIDAQKDENL